MGLNNKTMNKNQSATNKTLLNEYLAIMLNICYTMISLSKKKFLYLIFQFKSIFLNELFKSLKYGNDECDIWYE